MGSRRLDPAAQLNTDLRANPSPALEPLPQVILDRFGCDLGQRFFAETRPQELQRVHILLVIARAPKRRLGAPFQKPVRPLVERELLAA